MTPNGCVKSLARSHLAALQDEHAVLLGEAMLPVIFLLFLVVFNRNQGQILHLSIEKTPEKYNK